MGYTQELQYKILRTHHIVEFITGARARDIQNSIGKVPPEAKLLEIEEVEIPAGYPTIKLTFLEEVKE